MPGPRTRRWLALGLRLAAALVPFWALRVHLREGEAWLDVLLELDRAADRPASPAVRAHALDGAGPTGGVCAATSGAALALGEELVALAACRGRAARTGRRAGCAGAAARAAPATTSAHGRTTRRVWPFPGPRATRRDACAPLVIWGSSPKRKETRRRQPAASTRRVCPWHARRTISVGVAAALIGLGDVAHQGEPTRRQQRSSRERIALPCARDGPKPGIGRPWPSRVADAELGDYARAAALHVESAALCRAAGR